VTWLPTCRHGNNLLCLSTHVSQEICNKKHRMYFMVITQAEELIAQIRFQIQ
jgi:hypothetical protein